MARPEIPIDPRTGPQAAFAVELRQLRELAGVTYRELAQRAHYSQGALCEAARGRQLPSWEVTKAFVAGCGGDEQQWWARWEAAAAEIGIDSSPATALGGASDVREPLPGRDVPVLSSLTSSQEFHRALRALRTRAGNPSLRELGVLARKNGGHVLPRSTLADALTRTDHLPSLEIVEAFLSACDVPAAEVNTWKSAWIRVAYHLQRDSTPGGRRWQTCPYLGLAAFAKDQAEIFHGRRGVTADLLKQLDGRVRGGVGMLVVTGPSGAGKSSLLQAGLLPVLEKGALGPGSEHWPYLVITPGSAPLDALALPLAQLAGVNSAEVKESLAQHPDTAYLNARQALLARLAQQPESESRALPGRLVLIVDQFEELFTVVRDKAEREAFITSLCAMAGVGCDTAELPPAIVVLGLRADFISHCAAHALLAEAARSSVFMVGPMTEAELQLAITGPVKAAGLSVEAGLVDDVLAELRSTGTPGEFDPGALPLLSQAMLRTWEHREGTTLTRQAYVTGGGLRNSIQTSAEAAYHNLTPEQREAARTLFRRMVTFTDQGKPSRCKIQLSDLDRDPNTADDLKAALEEFANQRLVTLHEDTAEIVHEVLLHTWTQLESWIAQDREWLNLSNELLDAASVWEKNGQDPAFLYRGSRLDTAQESANKIDFTVPPSVQSFLDASRIHERRRTRKLHALRNMAVSLLAVVALLAVAVAFQHRTNMVARAGGYAANARLLAGEHPETAMLLGVGAFQLIRSAVARGALLSAQSQYFAGQLVGHTGPIEKVVFSPSGNVMATASADGTARLWDVASHQLITTLSRSAIINDVEFSSNGRLLATAEAQGIVHLWDAASYQLVGTLTDASGRTISAATFSPDGRFLATTNKNGIVQFWDLASRQSIAQLNSPYLINMAVFSPNERFLATTDAHGIVQLWNVTDPRHATLLGSITTPQFTLRGQPPPPTDYVAPINVDTVVSSPDANTLATAGTDGIVRLWDVRDPHHPSRTVEFSHNQKIANQMAFSRDGKILAIAGEDGTAQLWDVTHRHLAGALGGHNGAIRSVAFRPDGHTVATAGADGIVRLWDIGGPILSSPNVSPGVRDIEFSPDGRTLATVGADNTVRLWDMVNRQITTPVDRINTTAFSQDGRLLATVGEDSTVRLWDMANPHQIAPLANLAGPIKNVAFGSKNHIMATTGTGKDGVVQLWNVTDPSHPAPLGSLPLAHNTGKVVFSGDGRLVATLGDDGTVGLWDIVSRHLIAKLNDRASIIQEMAFSTESNRLVTASVNGTVQKWEVTTGKSIGRTPLSGEHSYPVALSPDGSILATTSSDDTTTKLWSTDHDGQLLPIATLAGHTAPIDTAAFRDSHFLATASADGTVRLWDLDTDRVTNNLCRIVGAVAEEQWTKLIPELPYQPICH